MSYIIIVTEIATTDVIRTTDDANNNFNMKPTIPCVDVGTVYVALNGT